MVFAEDIKDTVGETEAVIDGIISFNLRNSGLKDVQDYIDTKIPDMIGGTGEWYVLGLLQSGSYDFRIYRTALEQYLKDNDVKGATTRLKFAIVLTAVDIMRLLFLSTIQWSSSMYCD